MSTKKQLFDCCGARHLHAFPRTMHDMVWADRYKPLWNSPGGYVLIDALVLMNALVDTPNGSYVDLVGKVPGVSGQEATHRVYGDHPGVTTAVITRQQNEVWGEWLTSKGFTLTANNIRNRNSGNQLFCYMRIDRPHNGGQVGYVDNIAVPVRFKSPRHLGVPYRVRHPVTNELVVPEIRSADRAIVI